MKNTTELCTQHSPYLDSYVYFRLAYLKELARRFAQIRDLSQPRNKRITQMSANTNRAVDLIYYAENTKEHPPLLASFLFRWELFYQIMLFDFGNFGMLKLSVSMKL